MIKFGILTCDNCREILSTGGQMLEQDPAVTVLDSAYVGSKQTGEGIHVCSARCERGEYYNKTKRAKKLMHVHFYGSTENR